MLTNSHQFRASVLARQGANEAEIQELLTYNRNIFCHSNLISPLHFPLVSEPHVATWENYAAQADEIGAFDALKQHLVQLQFPVKEGISKTEAYQAATLQGMLTPDMAEASALVQHPERIQLTIHQSLAGAIPVLIVGNRSDFVTLVHSLTMQNEPKFISDSMGACMVAGFNNWDRIRQYRKRWESEHPNDCSERSWSVEFRRLIPRKELYQDRFIILSEGFYSNISALDVGIEEQEWQCISLKIRLEHECTHYFTRRLFGSMQNNLLDELIADYRGIVAAIGRYRADWFLRFMGLESFPHYRAGGRLENYRGQPPLSDQAFNILQNLVKIAAENLQRFDTEYCDKLKTMVGQTLMLIALTHLTIEELASEQAFSLIEEAWNKAAEIVA